ncbi:MAG TPA: acyl-CoA carboxylase subunit beta [Gemmatimonadaceae bacterium]|nr:acyl-CoA carboxylase subunit beta [Gemmatimonadaceae bacterium]
MTMSATDLAAAGEATDPARARLLQRRAKLTNVARPPRERTARERVAALCDEGTFTELDPFRRARGNGRPDGDGVVTAWGTIAGRTTVVIAHDFSVAGGSIGAVFAEKVTRAQRLALERRCPIVYLNDSGGARIHEGIEALHGCGEIMALNVAARRAVPQISVILGPCAGAAAYSPALTDWTIMVTGRSQMFLTGPEVVRAATGEQIDPESLGGAALHIGESGVAHLEARTEDAALATTRRLLSYLPQAAGANPLERLPAPPPPARAAALAGVVPAHPGTPFDMLEVLAGIFDAGVFFEVMGGIAPSLVTGFARLDGLPVGVVASQPGRRGGILDGRTATKGARFVDFCGRFGLPILTFVDVPGFLPGSTEERRGIIAHGASLLAAYVEAPVPKLTVIVRKAYGGAYIALGSRSLGADFCWAWPGAEIAVMGPEAAVGLLHRRDLELASDPQGTRRELAAEYRSRVTSPFVAAESGIIDEVILPEETRERLIGALRFSFA